LAPPGVGAWKGCAPSSRPPRDVRRRDAPAPVDLAQVGPVTTACPGQAELAASPDGEDQPMRRRPISCRRAEILLDRDGTIIVDHGYVGSIDRVEFIEGAPEAIARFNRANIPVAVVTNQAGVARGLYGIDDVDRVHRYIAECLAEYGAHIDQFLYCPYHP
jgi:hypothetical protein